MPYNMYMLFCIRSKYIENIISTIRFYIDFIYPKHGREHNYMQVSVLGSFKKIVVK